MDRAKPAHTIRFGRIKATIWANKSHNGIRHNVQVCRIYRDGDVWKQSDSFGRDDLPLVCKALDQAHTWIYQTNRTELGTTGQAKPGDSVSFSPSADSTGV